MLSGWEARRDQGAAQCAIILRAAATSTERLAGSVAIFRQRSKLPAFACSAVRF